MQRIQRTAVTVNSIPFKERHCDFFVLIPKVQNFNDSGVDIIGHHFDCVPKIFDSNYSHAGFPCKCRIELDYAEVGYQLNDSSIGKSCINNGGPSLFMISLDECAGIKEARASVTHAHHAIPSPCRTCCRGSWPGVYVDQPGLLPFAPLNDEIEPAVSVYGCSRNR